jgi:hypothetical protein
MRIVPVPVLCALQRYEMNHSHGRHGHGPGHCTRINITQDTDTGAVPNYTGSVSHSHRFFTVLHLTLTYD